MPPPPFHPKDSGEQPAAESSFVVVLPGSWRAGPWNTVALVEAIDLRRRCLT